MKYRAVVTWEGAIDMPWFVYIEGATNGRSMAARFSQRINAERAARAMNRAWENEGRLAP
jgi:hypothetical protein